MSDNKAGDLRVWWIPQVPMAAFRAPVKDVEQAIFLLNTLADYDAFQFENNVKPDYCNAAGLEVFEIDEDGQGHFYEWEDLNGNCIDDVRCDASELEAENATL